MMQPAGRIGPAGLARLTLRVGALALWLVMCVALHGLWRLGGARPVWPRRFLGGLCRIVGVRVSCDGAPAAGSAVLLVNHVSWIDIPAVAGATGTAFVAHSGLAQLAIVRWICAMNDTVFIARHDRASVQRQVEQVRTAIADTGALALFPEGTTSDGAGLLPFKSSLLAAVAPPPEGTVIQPVVLDYGPRANEIAWVGTEPGLDNFKRIVAGARPVELTIRFLAPLALPASADRKAIAQVARAEMLAAMPGWQ